MEPAAIKGKTFSLTELERLEAEAFLAKVKLEAALFKEREQRFEAELGARVLKRVGAGQGAYKTEAKRSEDGRSILEIVVTDAGPTAESVKA